nr:hypothetical protein [Methanohalophilus profundi]
MKPDDVVVDMFAGVGPYSIPAAKKCGYVYSIDKNPQAVEYLQKTSNSTAWITLKPSWQTPVTFRRGWVR